MMYYVIGLVVVLLLCGVAYKMKAGKAAREGRDNENEMTEEHYQRTH